MILEEILKILKKKSENKAYTMNMKSYTYADLYKYVCNIYHYLLKENQEKRPVIVYGHKQIYMKASFLACSFAGMAYVPVDDTMPAERKEMIINQVKPKVIITPEIEYIMNQEIYKDIENIYLEPDDIYYIIFTSGSTGIPKGVKVTYKNIDSCIRWLRKITNVEKGVILNQANFSFDLSVADLYLSLISESEHFILEDNTITNFKEIFKELKCSKATLAVMTPSFMDLLLLDKSFNQDMMPKLEKIIFCGERLKTTTVKKIYERFENLDVINCYGPTEATFAVTSMKLPRNLKNIEEIPCGKAKDDVNIHIVNEHKEILNDGQVGEILIVGESVADGYLGSVKNNSFINYEGKKAYLTGDIGSIKENILYYKCRKDNQIKYKGYRIELSDIESNLEKIDYIEKSKVVAIRNEEENITKLLAFVKLKENMHKNEFEIRKNLLKKLPKYMCPNITLVDKFPINKNGKCDEKKLMEDYLYERKDYRNS